jgi:N-acyl homoserine lactone hydrolase
MEAVTDRVGEPQRSDASWEDAMLRALSLFVVGVCANVLVGLPAFAQSPAEVTLTRIDCGTGATPTDVGQRFTDTFAYKDLKLTFTFSCYLIKHGNDYMVWDTGFAPGTSPNAPKVGIVDRLKELKVTPEQVKYVGISHFHADHTGQLSPFTNATLLIGKGDWDGITAPTPMQGANVAGFKSWLSESRKVEPLTGDKDVFGDGSVIVLRMPGHTPGHSCLLVRLKEMGPVLLSGDLVHFRENYESAGVPSFNVDRAATVASIERMKQIVANLKATVVIQHDMRDIGKLPAFPAAAK